MALACTLRTAPVRPILLRGSFLTLLTLLALVTHLSAAPAYEIENNNLTTLTVTTEVEHTYIVNGVFGDGDDDNEILTFAASLLNGSSLPSWIKLNSQTGVFTVKAPSAARGQVIQVRLMVNGETSTTFAVVVDDASLGCSLDANTDGLARFLDCDTGKARLRGYSSTGSYRWSGPNGFTSSSQEPDVTAPGLYVLTAGDASCARTQAIEVRRSPGGDDDCITPEKNVIPVAKIDADRFTGQAPLTINFDGLLSYDNDGSIIDYQWNWEGVTAAGPTPTATFPAGTYKVVLTVTDDTGAKSTDYVTVEVTNSDYVRYRSYWLEAECAEVGGKWTTGKSSSASEGSYVTAQTTAVSAAPADVPENRIRFSLTDAVAGNYYLFARIDAATNTNDSYWVRVNGKQWMEWSTGIESSRGFQWNEMAASTLYLNEGSNTIDFAFREADTRLDKLHLNQQRQKPSGTGDAATNCYAAANEAPVAVASASTYSGTAPLAVTLNGSGSTDSDGQILDYKWSWTGGTATGVSPQINLPVGSYAVTLTVRDDDGATATAIVKINVAEEVVTNANSIWLEAECAVVGSNWATRKSTSASGESYVIANAGNAYHTVPADLPENRIRFTFDSPSQGLYKVFARINAPTNGDDSFWVRINGGTWIKWYSGITQGGGFNWNRLPGGTQQLVAGTNTIDFAFRENGTMLDKLYLTGSSTVPSGLGGTASNCKTQTESTVYTQWLEAECAQVGAGWERQLNSASSNGQYLVSTSNNQYNEPAVADLSQQVKFTAYAQGSGTFHLYLRLDAPDLGSNSLWVKVDDGKWMKLWTEIGGANLLTQGFEWRKVNDDGKAVSFNLNAGNHTITIANRETGTKLDKVALSLSAAAPSGMGGQATNCDATAMAMGSSTGMSMTQSTASAQPEATTEGVTVYPNPAVDDINVSLTSAFEGDVQVTIIDVNGREVATSTHAKAGEQLSVNLKVRDLPSGVYRVRIVEGDTQRVESFVRL